MRNAPEHGGEGLILHGTFTLTADSGTAEVLPRLFIDTGIDTRIDKKIDAVRKT